jgi:hypothetical protein
MDFRQYVREQLPSLLTPREPEILEELAQHLEDLYWEQRSGGLDHADALARAARALTASLQSAGDIRSTSRALAQRLLDRVQAALDEKEGTRRVRVWAWLGDARQDLRYALRSLRRSQAFATAAAATLALAIGINTTMFGVLNAVLLRALPYRSPEQLTMLWAEDPAQNFREGRSTRWDVEQWRRQSQSFADLATFDAVSKTLTGPEGAEQIVGASISPNRFPGRATRCRRVGAAPDGGGQGNAPEPTWR